MPWWQEYGSFSPLQVESLPNQCPILLTVSSRFWDIVPLITSPFPRTNRNGCPFVFSSNFFPFLVSFPIYRIPNFVPFLAFGPLPILCSSITTPFASVTFLFSGLTSVASFGEIAGFAGAALVVDSEVDLVGPCSSFGANWTFFSVPLTGAASPDLSFCFLSFFFWDLLSPVVSISVDFEVSTSWGASCSSSRGRLVPWVGVSLMLE